jgi:hypothetical protein
MNWDMVLGVYLVIGFATEMTTIVRSIQRVGLPDFSDLRRELELIRYWSELAYGTTVVLATLFGIVVILLFTIWYILIWPWTLLEFLYEQSLVVRVFIWRRLRLWRPWKRKLRRWISQRRRKS